MKQQTLAAQASFERYGRKSRRELFLDEMERVVPWPGLEELVEPYYARAGRGRQPVGLRVMLRVYFVQQWFNLSDPSVEEALSESPALRRFTGVDLGRAAAPDETTVCRFRHLLERHELGPAMLDSVNHHLAAHGIRIATGTIVGGTIIAAPSSTKNKTGERDPEMHQTIKGNQWHFGLKAHIGVDYTQRRLCCMKGSGMWSPLPKESRPCLSAVVFRSKSSWSACVGIASTASRALLQNQVLAEDVEDFVLARAVKQVEIGGFHR